MRDNSSLLVTCTDVGLAGAVDAFKRMLVHLVSSLALVSILLESRHALSAITLVLHRLQTSLMSQ